MSFIKRIAAATDFSPAARIAESRAAMLCAALRLPALDLFNVERARVGSLFNALDTVEQETMLAERAIFNLKTTANRLESDYGVGSKYHIRLGDAATELVSLSEACLVDLMVIGDSGPKGFARQLLGSVQDKLLRMTGRPLLIARNAPDRHYRKVLIPVDFSLESAQAAKMAVQMTDDAHLVFLHAYRVESEGLMRETGVAESTIEEFRARKAERARAQMRQFIQNLGPIPQVVTSAVEFGWATPVITRYAERFGPDLIVLGRHKATRIEELLLGSVSQRAVKEICCDVLIAIVGAVEDGWIDRPAA